jgi:hypothetical protein
MEVPVILISPETLRALSTLSPEPTTREPPPLRSADPSLARELTEVENSQRERERQAATICTRASQRGYVMHEGEPAKIGTLEYARCTWLVEPMLTAGRSESEIMDELRKYSGGFGPNWLWIGGAVGIAAVALAVFWPKR